ncbi:MAG: redoxin domain-containing (seleno)protein, partial [Dehalococcoidia bacterium]
LSPPDDGHARATTLVRLAQHIWSAGHTEDARALMSEAESLWPDSWAIRRQAWNLEHPLKAGGPEFWAAVDALGDRPYYNPVTDI